MKLNHHTLLETDIWLRDAPNSAGDCGRLAHVEFDFARQFDDGFGMMAVFEQCVFNGLRAADEQAAIKTVLFLGDPLAAPVPADKDDCRERATRWRFDELHVGIPSGGEPSDLADGLAHAVNIFSAGYEFESGGMAIA
jgi:hypothetical protein